MAVICFASPQGFFGAVFPGYSVTNDARDLMYFIAAIRAWRYTALSLEIEIVASTKHPVAPCRWIMSQIPNPVTSIFSPVTYLTYCLISLHADFVNRSFHDLWQQTFLFAKQKLDLTISRNGDKMSEEQMLVFFRRQKPLLALWEEAFDRRNAQYARSRL